MKKEEDGQDNLAQRMKSFELNPRIDPTKPFLVRLDGHRFSKFTSGFSKPYDMRIFTAMQKTTGDLIQHYPQCTTGYTQSDEISLVFPFVPTKEEEGEEDPYSTIPFGGKIQKLVSLMAAFCSVRFVYHLSCQDFPEENLKNRIFEAYFDARVFSLPSSLEIANNIFWRQCDCKRNSKNNLAHVFFQNSKSIHGLKSSEVLEKLRKERGIHWKDMHSFYKFGCFIKKQQFSKEAKHPKDQELNISVSRTRVVYAPLDIAKLKFSDFEFFLTEKYSNSCPDLNLWFLPLSDLSSSMKKAKAVIFDLDGLLLDTEPVYQQAIQKVTSIYGKNYTDDVRKDVMGKPELIGAGIICNRLDIPLSPENFLEERDKFLNELFLGVNSMPGAMRLCRHFFQSGIPIIVATSSNYSSIKLKFHKHPELLSMFGDNLIAGDNPMIKNGKPAPDIFLAAAKQLNADPNECIVFEDSPAGVQAAKAANMTAIAIPDPLMLSTNVETYEKADLLLPSLGDFQPEQFGFSPFDIQKS